MDQKTDSAAAKAELELQIAQKDAALRKALNYIENTESELGITLDCGVAIRAALAPAAQSEPCPACAKKDAALQTLRAAFRVNMLRAFPDKSHAEIDAEIDAALAPAAPVETGDNQDGRAKPVDHLLERRAGDSSGAACIAIAAQPVAPAPSAGETRAAIIEQCAKVAEAYDCHPDEIHGHSIADNIRTLAAAPTTGETPGLVLTHAQAMAGYAVACKFGVLEAGAFQLTNEMFAAFATAAPTTGETT